MFSKKYVRIAQLLLLILTPALFLGLMLAYVHASGPTPFLVKNINQSDDSTPIFLTNVNGTLYFFADDGVHGWELWKSDGTMVGTTLVSDINPIGDSVFLGNAFPVNIGNILYFAADDGTHGYELWKSDGTITGTKIVSDVNPGADCSNAGQFVTLNGTLYFAAFNTTNGNELWKSDGTLTGTTLITDINPGSESALFPFSGLSNVDGTLYVIAYDGVMTNEKLWKSDGTAAGTSLVKDVIPKQLSTGEKFTGINGTVYFGVCSIAGCPFEAEEFWKSDGTTVGTVLVKDIAPYEFLAIGNVLYIGADDGVDGQELWKSDGTMGGTVLITDINPSGSSAPASLTNVNGTLFFSADDGTNGRELWKSDGTASGTMMVENINPGAASSSPTNLIEVNGFLYFIADNGSNGIELWKSDGTITGTAMVEDINLGANGALANFPWLANIDDELYFSADDGNVGIELWKLIDPVSNSVYLPLIIKEG